jgi:D-aminopeptidase
VLCGQHLELRCLVPGIECKVGCILHYVARDFPTTYQVAELITTLGAT